jgi:exoribonuclease-2
VPGTESLARGTRVRARISGMDLLTLDLHTQFAGRIEEATAATDDAAAELDDDVDTSGPLTLAIDLSDATESAEPASPVPGDESTAAA